MSTNSPTIIIPIYNASEQLKNCLDSISTNTPKHAPIILINDASTEKEIYHIVDQFKEKWETLTVIHNDLNIGYTRSINKAILSAEKDVILLNSDTIVSLSWYQNLIACKDFHSDSGTITPLFDNSGVFSFPSIIDRQFIEKSSDRNDFQQYLSNCYIDHYPETPTGHGCCMLITKEAISKVGFFDEVRFSDGYGSEVDFSQRCIQSGFRNYLDYKTIIFHYNAASFGKRKKELINKTNKTIEESYPNYKDDVIKFSENGIINLVRSTYNKNSTTIAKSDRNSLTSKKPSIVIFIHDSDGGTIEMTDVLIQELSKKYNCYLLKTNSHQYNLYYHSTNRHVLIKTYIFSKRWHISDQACKNRKKALNLILESVKPQICLIRHFIYLHPEIIPDIQHQKIKTIISIHDYYLTCPNYQLLDNRSNYCKGECNGDKEDCKTQSNIEISTTLKNEYVLEWRKRIYFNLKACDCLIFNSHFCKKQFEHTYPNLKSIPRVVIEHGSDLKRFRSKDYASINHNAIAFLGNLTQAKGGQLIRSIAVILHETHPHIRLHIFGNSSISPETFPANTIFHGPYSREDITHKLNELMPLATILPSLWPETFCNTYTESLLSGIPVLLYATGAPCDRSKRDNCNWIVQSRKPEDWAKKLVDLQNNPISYNKNSKNLSRLRFKNAKEMGIEYASIFNAIKTDQRILAFRAKTSTSRVNFPFFRLYL